MTTRSTDSIQQRKLELEVALLELEQRKREVEIGRLELEHRKLEIEQAAYAEQLEWENIKLRIEAQQDQENWKIRAYNQRIFHFNDQIFGESVAFCMQRLRDLVDLDHERPIELVFNSPGGSVIDGFELYDYLMSLRADGVWIDTTVLGMGASMAGVIAQAGKTRKIGPNSRLMIHEVGSLSYGKLSSMKDHLKMADQLYDQCLGILASRAKLTIDEIRQRAERKDWWLQADEALEHGFVDAILPIPQVS